MGSSPRISAPRGWTVAVVLVAVGAVFLPARVRAATPELERLDALIAASRYDDAFALGDSLRAAVGGGAAEAEVLDRLVEIGYRTDRAFDDATVDTAERAVALKESAHGPGDPAVATSLAHLANLLNERRECVRALPFYDRAIAILEGTGGDHDAALAMLLSSRGVASRRLGRYDAARRDYERALAMQERVLGQDGKDLAGTLNNLAIVLIQLGDYSRARACHERALAIRELHFGPDHEWVAESLNNLSTILGYMGEYDASLRAQERAVDLFRRRLGDEHERTAWAELNLGIVSLDMGAFADAVPVFEKALAKIRSLYGPEHVETTYVLDALAAAHDGVGDHAAALDLYETSLGITESARGKDNPGAVDTMEQIGHCLTALGRLDEAEAMLTRCLGIRQRGEDPDSPLLCGLLNRISDLLLELGRPSDALGFADRSARIVATRLDGSHPLLAAAEILAARALAALDRRDEALARALEAERIAREHLSTTMRVLSEEHALDYARSRAVGLDLALEMLAPVERSGRTAAVWDALIRGRALVLDGITSRNRRLVGGGSAAVDSLLARSLALRERLSNLVLRGPGWEDVDDYRALIGESRAEIAGIERRLALTDADGPDDRLHAVAGLGAVRSALAPGDALIAYARHGDDPAYTAFVMTAGDEAPTAVLLGAAGEIDTLVTAWLDRARLVPAGTEAASSRGILSLPDDRAANLAAYRDAGGDLRRRIWDPLAAAVAEARRVLLVMDGNLHLVNLVALPEAEDRYLLDQDRVFHVLDTERALAASSGEPAAAGILMIGDADYGAPGASTGEGFLAGVRFRPLPHARTEIATLRSLALAGPVVRDIAVLTGAEATESGFKRLLPGRGILHLATHGFFAPRAAERAGVHAPLVVSGLALAGANTWRQAATGAVDGLLTAEEVSGLDLGDVDWAVLSACETGLGSLEVRGEGVFGLRRAFALAGARTVIMSLWSVDDRAAAAWMSALYASRLADGASTEIAVRQASRSVLAVRRAEGLDPHPYYWAGFVAAGDWR